MDSDAKMRDAAWEAYEADEHRRAAPLLAELLVGDSETLEHDAECWLESEILGVREFARELAKRMPGCWGAQKALMRALARTRDTEAVFLEANRLLGDGRFAKRESWLRMQRLDAGLQLRVLDAERIDVVATDFVWVWKCVRDAAKADTMHRSWVRRLLGCPADNAGPLCDAIAKALVGESPAVAELLRHRAELARDEERLLSSHFG